MSHPWSEACADRLVDNYEWQDIIEPEDWEKIKAHVALAIRSYPERATLIKLCLDNGVVEEDYFD